MPEQTEEATYWLSTLGQGFRSGLGVPLGLGESASAVLNFFAASNGTFTEEIIQDAQHSADVASPALRLGLRIAAAELPAEDQCHFAGFLSRAIFSPEKSLR